MGLTLVQRCAAYAALIALSVLPLLPLVWMLSSSLKTDSQIFPPEGQSEAAVTLARLLPRPIHWSNYPQALHMIPFLVYLKNTLFLCLVTVLGAVFSSAIVAYGFARIQFKGKQPLFLLMIATMVLPGQVTMIPVFALFRWLSWYGTYLPLTVPSFFGSPFYIFLLTQFYRTLPEELSEAARVDGAGEGWIFLRIVLPLMRGPLGALAVLAFFQAWTAFAWPLVVMTNKETYTLEVGLALFQTGFTVDIGRLSAAAALALVPSALFFSLMRRNFVRGVAASGLKE